MDEAQIALLVEDWDEMYKRSQLTLWIMLALGHGEKYAAEIAQFMDSVTGGVFVVQEQSLYRALRRFRRMALVQVREGESEQGPKRKYYSLTDTGREVLGRFLRMHIAPMYSAIAKDTISAMMHKKEIRGEE